MMLLACTPLLPMTTHDISTKHVPSVSFSEKETRIRVVKHTRPVQLSVVEWTVNPGLPPPPLPCGHSGSSLMTHLIFSYALVLC